MSATPRIAAAQLAPTDLVERVLGISERLIDIIRRETVCLEQHQALKIVELQDEKLLLANEYAMDVQAIAQHKHLIDRAPAEKIARLKAAMTRLDAALAANQNVLGATKSVSERILKSISDTVNQRKAPTLGYGRNAAMTRPTPGQNAAIALDSRI
jgi:hypothetical protein